MLSKEAGYVVNWVIGHPINHTMLGNFYDRLNFSILMNMGCNEGIINRHLFLRGLPFCWLKFFVSFLTLLNSLMLLMLWICSKRKSCLFIPEISRWLRLPF